ncbi:unnamed protein product, partial [Chrysoparadoxa australica]
GGCELEIVLQDRDFVREGSDKGRLAYDADFETTGEPLILPEFFGPYVLANGAIWPKFDVSQRWYRIRWLDGADSRTFLMQLVVEQNPDMDKVCGQVGHLLPVTIIGTDQ